MSSNRIDATFAALQRENRAAFIPFMVAGDPDAATSLNLLQVLVANGADILEIGMPFTDPMADGAAIQAAARRALRAGMDLRGVLQLVQAFRRSNTDTPIVLMGYYNPLYHYGVEAFCADAARCGVDGLLIVDVPPEEAAELAKPATAHGMHLVRLIAPTTPPERQQHIVRHAGGFVYYVAITGITGTTSGNTAVVHEAIRNLKQHTPLPVGVGFGIRTPEQAAGFAQGADAVIVGSILAEQVAKAVQENTVAQLETLLRDFVAPLAEATHNARK